jgi:ABC-type glycerol-3-phosphate transport system substrate-binding protein
MDGFMDPEVLNLTAAQKQFVIESVANGRNPLVVMEQAKMDNIFSEELDLLANGAKDVDQVIADIKAAWEPLLEEE